MTHPRSQPYLKARRSSNAVRIVDTVDKYVLYQQAVQDPPHEVHIYRRMFRYEYNRAPLTLREDFCGSAAVSCEWVRSHRDHEAYAIDLDEKPLAWAKRHNVAALSSEQKQRVHLMQGDVRTCSSPTVDIVIAQNFSYWVFKTRDALRHYFQASRTRLKREGLFILDAKGGPQILREDHEEQRKCRGFYYIWHQDRFDPITHQMKCHIHFRFPDGSEWRNAFSYHWRFWTLPEIQELLLEAGFQRVDVYWEGTSRRTGKGNNIYYRRTHAECDPAWICYLVAVR